jgi:hypothetical protein
VLHHCQKPSNLDLRTYKDIHPHSLLFPIPASPLVSPFMQVSQRSRCATHSGIIATHNKSSPLKVNSCLNNLWTSAISTGRDNWLVSVRFQVLTIASMKIIAFWDMAPCNLVVVDWQFRGAYCRHHQHNHHPDDRGSTHLYFCKTTKHHNQKAVIFNWLVT